VLQSGMLGLGAYLVMADRASGGIMIASSIMMGRALAPVEIALGSWKQLVAARQGIARLRDICRVTAKPAAPRFRCPGPAENLLCRISPSPRRVATSQSCRIFRFRSKPAAFCSMATKHLPPFIANTWKYCYPAWAGRSGAEKRQREREFGYAPLRARRR
jgi:hypothetical protein